jgi:selenocysteine-specific elongation factor
LQTVESYHNSYPLRRGIPREELKSRLRLSPRVFNAMIKKLEMENLLADMGGIVSLTGHEIKFDNGEQAKVQALMRKFEQNPYSPPSVRECQAEVGEEILNALIELNELIAVSPDVIFRKRDYDLIVQRITETIRQTQKITLAEVRDLFDTSRKFAQALLEYLDSIGVTLREGDFRKLRNK